MAETELNVDSLISRLLEGVSRADYLKAKKQLLVLQFVCGPCKQSQAINISTYGIDSALHSTLLDTSTSSTTTNQQTPPGTFLLDLSLNTTATTNTTNAETDLFDVTRDDPPNTTAFTEPSINGEEEPPMSTTVIEEPGHVQYTVIEEGTVRQRSKLVSSDGFAYIVKRTTKQTVQWRCNQRRTGQICYASVRQEGDIFSRGTISHNHPANPLVRQKVELSRDLKREAVRDVHGPTTAYVEGQMQKQFKDRVQNGRVVQNGQIPKPTSLVRVMNRVRQKVRPKESDTLDFEVDTNFLEDEFLVGDVWVGDERHLIFATSEQLQLLQTARKWYLDGTFKVVRKPFSQLWSIHAFIREGESMKQVPLMFVLMSRRRKQDYTAVLGKILDILPEAPAVECFCMDFEIGLWQALREVFPGTIIQGCAFHWAQSINKHVKNFGLAKTYQERPTVRQLISKLLALPFLPGRDIERAFNRLQDRAATSSESVRDLFDYVEDTWVDTTLWSTDEWSVYKQPVRTNNDTEGWHRKLNQKAGRGSLAFYVLVPLLLEEAKNVTVQFQLVSQESLIRNRRAVYVSMDEKIGELWDKYDNHDIVCEDFLAGVGEIYGRV